MSTWVQIEHRADELSAGAQFPVEPALRPSAAEREPVVQLRRHERPVLGSVDAGSRLLQRLGRPAIVGGAALLLPSVLCNVGLVVLAFERYGSLDSVLPRVPETLGGSRVTGVEQLVLLISLLLSSYVAALVGAYATSITLSHQSGAAPGIRRGIVAVGRRLHTLTLAWALSHWWLAVGALVYVSSTPESLPALTMLFGPVALCLAATSLVVAPVVIAEQRTALATVRRAWQMGRASFGAAFGAVVVSGIVGGGVRLAVTSVPDLLWGVLALFSGDEFVPTGWWVTVAEGVASQLGVLISTPLVALATVQFYVQLRIRTEGADLVAQAQQVFEPSHQ